MTGKLYLTGGILDRVELETYSLCYYYFINTLKIRYDLIGIRTEEFLHTSSNPDFQAMVKFSDGPKIILAI